MKCSLALASVALLCLALPASSQSVRASTKKVTGGQKGKTKTTVLMPTVSGSSAVVSFANRSLRADAAKVQAAFQKDAAQSLAGYGKDLPGPFELYLEPTFTLLSPNWVCGYWTIYQFTGGAHGMTTFASFNYTLVNGKPKNAGLADLFANAASAASDLTAVLTQKLFQNPNATFIADGTSKVDAGTTPFAMTKTGMTFLFEPYICGPYSAGTFKVPVAFGEIQATMKLRP